MTMKLELSDDGNFAWPKYYACTKHYFR